MTTYYVSPDGSDSNNGLGPDASHATNKPWLTPNKVFAGGTTIVVPGDTVWFAPGAYYSVNLVPTATIASVGTPSFFRGDPLNAQGFKTSGGVRRAPGPVYITSRTSGELDAAPASGSSCLNLITNSPKGLQFFNLTFEGMGSTVMAVQLGGNAQSDCLWEDCRLIGARAGVAMTAGAPTAGRNLIFRRCLVSGGNASFYLRPAVAAATADPDLNILIEHCLLFGNITLQIGAAAANAAGGVRAKGCTIISPGVNSMQTTATGVHSLTTTSSLEGCLCYGALRMFSSLDAGALADLGYNRGVAIEQANLNVTEDTNTKRSVAGHLMLPDLIKQGLTLPSDNWFGWSDDAVAAQYDSGWTNTDKDFRGVTERPWGAGPSIGYIEKYPFTKDATSKITGGGVNSKKITGKGERSYFLPVEAVETGIRVRTESVSYGGTNYPQMIIEPNPEIGVAGGTWTATDATEQNLTSTNFTPTAAGVIEVRLVSRSSSPSSETFFDLLAIGT